MATKSFRPPSESQDCSDSGRTKRRRAKPSRYEFEGLENEEQKLLQQALKNSVRDMHRVDYVIPDAPTYHPTIDEFRDPLGYIQSICAEVRKYGVCKIVPPNGWNPQLHIDWTSEKTFPTKLQPVHTLQEGLGFDDGRRYTISSYRKMSDEYLRSWKETHYPDREMTQADLEKDYWLMVETASKRAQVEYANDIDVSNYQSGFVRRSNANTQTENNDGVEPSDSTDMFSEAYYARTGWNLLNLASSRGSLLKYMKANINGINVPWLYIGMLFSTFCWHNEDNYLYSINYSHMGDIKQWYGVPGEQAKQFEKVAKNFLLESFKDSPDLLHHLTTQISPSLLLANGIKVYQIKHEPGTFVLTCPKSFHGGFSYGFNVGEAVNFALEDWLVEGSEAEERYRLFARPSVFSHHRLLLTTYNHRSDISPQSQVILVKELLRVLDEEVSSRQVLLTRGVRDITGQMKLPKLKFDHIDNNDANYDEMRCCKVCNYVCVLSAVACACDQKSVTCLRHAHALCKCAMTRRYLLVWMEYPELMRLKQDLQQTLKDLHVQIHCKAVKPTTTTTTIQSESSQQQNQQEQRVNGGASGSDESNTSSNNTSDNRDFVKAEGQNK